MLILGATVRTGRLVAQAAIAKNYKVTEIYGGQLNRRKGVRCTGSSSDDCVKFKF